MLVVFIIQLYNYYYTYIGIVKWYIIRDVEFKRICLQTSREGS